MEFLYLYLCMQDKYNIVNNYDLGITESEPSKMHNVRPYVYSRPWVTLRMLSSGRAGMQMIDVLTVVFFKKFSCHG